MAKRKVGRPPKYTKKIRKQLLIEFDEFINKETIPILAEFAYKHEVPKQTFYDWDEFSNLLKKCMAKKEANLEKGVLAGHLNSSMGIFSLKQLGWRDRTELEHTGEVKHTISMAKILSSMENDSR